MGHDDPSEDREALRGRLVSRVKKIEPELAEEIAHFTLGPNSDVSFEEVASACGSGDGASKKIRRLVRKVLEELGVFTESSLGGSRAVAPWERRKIVDSAFGPLLEEIFPQGFNGKEVATEAAMAALCAESSTFLVRLFHSRGAKLEQFARHASKRALAKWVKERGEREAKDAQKKKSVELLVAMGFSRETSELAYQSAGGDMETAVAMLLSNSEGS